MSTGSGGRFTRNIKEAICERAQRSLIQRYNSCLSLSDRPDTTSNSRRGACDEAQRIGMALGYLKKRMARTSLA